jgi:hypothetical protein
MDLHFFASLSEFIFSGSNTHRRMLFNLIGS